MFKLNRIVALLLTMVVMLSIAPVQSYAADSPSSWAVASVEQAKALGLTTPELLNNFTATTTRAEFCRAAVNFLRKYGYDVDKVTPKLFADTSDKDIGVAAALGITSAADTTRNLFSPNGSLTREQAATMLRNVLNVIGASYDSSAVSWTDAVDIASWAQSATDVMYSSKIMGGTSSTKLVFSPKTPYTHEQSITTILNLWNYTNKSSQTALTTEVYVDGVKFSFPTYVFNKAKYFNIRDIAYSFAGTSKEFNLKWIDYPYEDAREKDGYHIVSEKYVAVGGEMKPLTVNFSNATKAPIGGYTLWMISKAWSYQVDNAIFVDFKDLAFSLDFDYHHENDVIRIDTSKSYHTATGLEWWKINPETLSPLPNEWAPQYSFQMLLAKLENEYYPYRFVFDSYAHLEYLKNQPAEAYEGIGEEYFGTGIKTMYQHKMKVITYVNNWLKNSNIDVSKMSDSQKIDVIKLFFADVYLPDGNLNHNCLGNELHDIISPSNSLTLTTAIELGGPCGFYADIADALMYTMGMRYMLYNAGGTIDGIAHAWNGYWDSEIGEYIFFDVGFNHYNMRFEDLAGKGYVLETT